MDYFIQTKSDTGLIYISAFKAFMNTHPHIPFHTNLIEVIKKNEPSLSNLTKWTETEKKKRTENTPYISYFPLFLLSLFWPFSPFLLKKKNLSFSSFLHLEPSRKKTNPSFFGVSAAPRDPHSSFLFFFFFLCPRAPPLSKALHGLLILPSLEGTSPQPNR